MKQEENLELTGESQTETYKKPTIEIIEMEMEGILCASGDDYSPGGGIDW